MVGLAIPILPLFDLCTCLPDGLLPSGQALDTCYPKILIQHTCQGKSSTIMLYIARGVYKA